MSAEEAKKNESNAESKKEDAKVVKKDDQPGSAQPKKDDTAKKEVHAEKKAEPTSQVKSEAPKAEEKHIDTPRPEGEDKAKKFGSKKPDDAAVKKIEKPANCTVCNKPLKNKWYYRNRVYYCCKGCWKQAEKKAQAEKKEKDKTESKPNEGTKPKENAN